MDSRAKVYIAAAFRRFSKRDGINRAYGQIMDQEYVSFLEEIEEVFLDFGFDTCLPHRDEGMWGKVYYEPPALSALCLRHVQTSDLIFALAETGRGVHIELGYAGRSENQKLIMMYNEATEPSTLIYGLLRNFSPWEFTSKEQANETIVSYQNRSDLLNKLKQILSSEYDSKSRPSSTSRTNTAIIDVGSHTIKLKVLSHRPGSHPKTLHEAKHSLGIMGDVIKTGAFSDETISKIISLLQTWRTECLALACESFIVSGTAALRKARNADTLVTRLKEAIGFNLEILSPEKELEYVFSGVKTTFKPGITIAVLNLGGGSTQLGIGSNLNPTEQFLFDFGTRELTERWPWNKPMAVTDYEAMLNYVRGRIEQVVSTRVKRADRIVHTGGELDFMLRCQLPLTVSLSSPVHVSEVSVYLFSQFSQEFSRSDPGRIAKDFGLDSAWLSGAVASNVIALCAAEAVGAEAIIPSNFNISNGLLLSAK